MDRAIFRPTNSWFSTSAQMKPVSVDQRIQHHLGEGGGRNRFLKILQSRKVPDHTGPADVAEGQPENDADRKHDENQHQQNAGKNPKVRFPPMTHKHRAHELTPITNGRPGFPGLPKKLDYLPVILVCRASSSSFTLPPVSACCSTSITPCFTSFHSAFVVG